ncbi:MAG: (d)CMP kinase [Opitutae bacterium]|jgi:CMP/dCMP kinase|nr:(d)CMP kinase [Opitutae bacterium]
MSSRFYVVALDGGAGTGKSTTAHSLSRALNLMHVDTGSHYRAITRALLDLNISPGDAGGYLNKNKLPLSTQVIDGRSCLLIDGAGFEQSVLRSPEINESVSDFSSQASVRELLFDYQRTQVQVARENNFDGLVMEGRDIGTVILPDADLKIFLEADSGIRANRRIQDGESDQITNRDEKDTSRKIAPLIPANGCIHVDTGVLGIEEVTKSILDVIETLT